MTARRHLLSALIASTLMIAPAFASEKDEREGGILGTGIVGTITRLGSIIVNDQRITFPPDLPVKNALAPLIASQLVPGDTVAVIADLSGLNWTAQSIRRILPIIGPVTDIITSQSGRTLSIMGTQVLAGPTLASTVNEGDWVAISGLWQDELVIATRVEVVPPRKSATIIGSNLSVGASNLLQIGSTLITGIVPTHIRPGDVVRVTGVPEAGSIRATLLEAGIFDGKVGLVQAEGYLSPPSSTGLYTLLGTGMIAYTDQPDMIDKTAKALVCGYDDKLGGTSTSAADPELLSKLNCQ
ncbi:DUF5666 domain-containing protein [Pseudovibrio sp. Tun.PSC04-5.I4]|uniref:DUF5666 domain-containing protein n=1 Tax=Pseudovibrio sp. Tun.PSC04-5.I4 TaxID=1798213 RepID=UPI00088B45FF|nr:DUF5666 domain-containing protein [Pseudovibrio sp. Tun.PSC04-5.I4]SDQ24579.1 hypothetical protein SAMN04515695_0645 [Pseudovibrio sp. Tun.PSC04-5.I4]